MARTINSADYANKRNDILDVAQRLVESKGYEQVSIQDILAELDISKGAFYHYFPSKPALLEAMVERICEGVASILSEVAAKPDLTASQKLNQFYRLIGHWKTREKSLLQAFMRVWYADENAVLRQKIRAEMVRRIGPLFAQIIQQGMQQEVMAPAFPARAGELMVVLIQDMNDAVAWQLLASDAEGDNFAAAIETFGAYGDLMEKALGVAPGTLEIAEAETLKKWLVTCVANAPHMA
jgi:TetR/AcrR family transcriptional regulator, transcriptional repressor for nem operon